MTAYYNEVNSHAAGWLRNLATAGLICPGDVDERDIRDVCAADLRGYTQHHFFAGIGIWSLALRMAGWPDDRPVTTGSCPCQPFSQAGKGDGFADERHLWPAWHWLIQQHRPDTIFGEQVAGKDGGPWLDLVSADLETLAYSIAPVVLPVAGVGAPNARHRLFWVADASGQRCGEERPDHIAPGKGLPGGGGAVSRLVNSQRNGWCARRRNDRSYDRAKSDPAGQTCRLADADDLREIGRRIHGPSEGPGSGARTSYERSEGLRSTGSGLGHAGSTGLPHTEPQAAEGARWWDEGRATSESSGPCDPWRELEWIALLDGKQRPTQPGLFPLATRHPGDVAKLRAYGNAISPQVAAEMIIAYEEIRR